VAPDSAAGGRFGASIRQSGYLQKWLLLGLTIGIIAGLGAVVFYLALKYTGDFLLGYLAGYHVPRPVGEGGSRGPPASCVPGRFAGDDCRRAAVGIDRDQIRFLKPQATARRSHRGGTYRSRAIRFRVVLVKMVASALTIGSGGSAGREGPTAQISAGFSSLLTRRLNLSDEDGRIAVALGIGAGIGAIFAAPLGVRCWPPRSPIATTSTTAACCRVHHRGTAYAVLGLSWASIRCSATSTPSIASKGPGRCCGSW